MVSNPFSSFNADNLTPLPPKISLNRPNSFHSSSKSLSPINSNIPSLNSASTSTSTLPTYSSSGNSIWGTGGFIGRDKRVGLNSVGSRKGLLSEFGKTERSSRDEIKKMPGAYELEEETNRIQTHSQPKARITVSAGLISLVMLGVTLWYLIEVCWAILSDGVDGIHVFRWVELGCGLAALLSSLIAIRFLKTRRRSKFSLSLLLLLISILPGSLHLLLAITNLLLVFIWKDQLQDRCAWGIDVVWFVGNAGKICLPKENQAKWRSWLIAAGVRIIVIFIVDAIQLSLLLKFYHSLPISPRPHPRSSTSQLNINNSSHPDYLPPMPDSTKYRELNISEATTTFDPTQAKNSRISNSSRSRRREGGEGGGGVVWIASKVWAGVGWMFGVKSYEERNESREADFEFREGVDRPSWILPKRIQLDRSIHGDDDEETRIYAPEDLDDPPQLPSSTFSRISNSTTSLYESPHYHIPSSASTNQRMNSNVFYTDSEMMEDLHYFNEHDFDTRNNFSTDASEPEFSNGSQSRHYPTGSSGSTGGNLVYVRMSDGKLVRKLSTIASEASGEVYNGATSVVSFKRGNEI